MILFTESSVYSYKCIKYALQVYEQYSFKNVRIFRILGKIGRHREYNKK